MRGARAWRSFDQLAPLGLGYDRTSVSHDEELLGCNSDLKGAPNHARHGRASTPRHRVPHDCSREDPSASNGVGRCNRMQCLPMTYDMSWWWSRLVDLLLLGRTRFFAGVAMNSLA